VLFLTGQEKKMFNDVCPCVLALSNLFSANALCSRRSFGRKKNGCHPMLSLQAAELWKKMAEHSAPAQPQQISSSTILPSGCAAFF
jgi:hypothetical protein